MTFVKKDFKNIYESGIKELTDIETQAIEQAKKTRSDHSKKQKQTAQQSLEQLQTKSGLLQVELKQSINESLKKLQDTLAIENAQSEAFLDSLTIELKTLIAQMKVKLKALKGSHQENVDFARSVAAENYLSNTEHMSFALEQALSDSLQNLRTKAGDNLQGLELQLDKTVVNIQDNIDNVTKSTLVSLKDQVDTINDHASSLLKTLLLDSQNKLKLLGESARKAKIEVDSSAGSLLDVIANHADSIEHDINGSYENITTTHFKNADARLSNLADELSTLHDTTTEQLITVTDELSEDLLDRSKQAQVGLRDRCDDVVNRVDHLFNDFQGKLDTRLQFSRGQKQALESDKNRILNAVQNELVSIQKAFATKIAGMLSQSKAELIETTKSVEDQIAKSTDSLGDRMAESANVIQSQMENEVARFLKEISTVRVAALDEISVAAKGKIVSRDWNEQNNKSAVADEPENEAVTNKQLEKDSTDSSADEFITADSDQAMASISSESSSDSLLPEEISLDQSIMNEDINIVSGDIDITSGDTDITENKSRRSRRRRDNKE